MHLLEDEDKKKSDESIPGYLKCISCLRGSGESNYTQKKPQLGGGKESVTESSESLTSSQSSEGGSEGILQILRNRKFALKNELKEVRKQIRYLESSKRKKSKTQKKRKNEKETETHDEKVAEKMVTLVPPMTEVHFNDEEFGAQGSVDMAEIPLEFHEKEEACLHNVQEEDTGVEVLQGLQEIEVEDVSLGVGQTFSSFSGFADAFEKYCSATYTIVRKHKSWAAKLQEGEAEFPYRRIEYVCVNFGEPKRRQTDGSRPKQAYSATGCFFELHLQLNLRKKQYKITKFIDQHHSHVPNKDAFIHHRQKRKLSADEQALYVEKYMMGLEIPARKVKAEIAKDKGKFPTTKNLRRYVQTKLTAQGQPSQIKDLMEFLADLRKKDSGAVIKIVYADSSQQDFVPSGKGIVKVIFVQSSLMKKMFQKHGTVLLIDGTYNLTSVQYVLVPFHVVDNHFRTRFCGFALLSNETANVVSAAMEMFAEGNKELIDNLKYVVVDKDFVEIASIVERFGAVQIIICQWHAVRAIDRQIHKLCLPPHLQRLKGVLMTLSRTMIHANSQKEYFDAWSGIVQLGQKHEILTNFVTYMTLNWHNHHEMYSTYKLQQYGLFRTFTNNRAENFHKQLKSVIRRQSQLPIVVKKLFEIAESQATETTRLNVKSTQQIFVPHDTDDPLVKNVMVAGRGLLSHETLRRLQEECEAVKKVPQEHISHDISQTKCSQKSGPCNFFINFNLPCRHLLATRAQNDEPLLEQTMISSHWLIDHTNPEESQPIREEHNLDKFVKSLLIRRDETARKAKHRQTSEGPVKEISSVLSQYPERERQQFTYQLEMLINAWNNGIKTRIDEGIIKFLLSPKKTDITKDHEELGLEDLMFSPKKENPKYKTGGDIPKKKKRKGPLFSKLSERREKEKDSLDTWQTDANNHLRLCGASRLWTKEDFDRLLDETRVGAAAYLNDSHFHYASVLLKQQFCDIQSLQDTLDYKVTGLKKVDPTKPFIQPVHSGAFHWALLSNIPLSAKERAAGNKICLFDSLIHLERDSTTHCKVAPAITWQAAQLLKKDSQEDVTSIEVICMPCEQQQNAHDCGIFVVCNMSALAHGISPSDISYKGNLREQFLEMIKSGRLQMFQHDFFASTASSKIKFMTQFNGRIQKKVLLQKMYHSILPLCYCQMPETWDNIVTCDGCQKIFHQNCNLIGPAERGVSLAASLKQFFCFNCRMPGKYSVGYTIIGSPKNEDIEDIAAKISALPSYKLCHFYHLTERLKIQAPCTIHDYRTLEEIMIKYDLNSLHHKKGILYVTIRNFYNKNSSALGDCPSFEAVPIPQLMVFAVAMICDISETECPPIWTHHKAIEIGAKIADIRKENDTWVTTVEAHLQNLEKKMKILEKLSPAQEKAQDLISYLTNNLRESNSSVKNLSELLSHAETRGASEKQLTWRDEVSRKVDCFVMHIDSLFLELDNYLGSMK